MKRWLILALFSAVALAQQVNTDIVPASTGLNIGHSNQRWNGFFQNINIFGTCTLNGSACFGGGGGGSSVLFQTNGSANSSQTLFNFVNGQGTTVVNNGTGLSSTVSVNVAAGSPNAAVQFNCAGAFCGNSGFTFNGTVLTVPGLALSNALYMSTTCGAATPPAVTASTTVFAVGADCNPYWSNNGGTMTLMNAGGGGGVTGSGTTNFIPIWTGATALGNSQMQSLTSASYLGGGIIKNAYSLVAEQYNYFGNGFTLSPSLCGTYCASVQIANKFDNTSGIFVGVNTAAGLDVESAWTGSGTAGSLILDGIFVRPGASLSGSGSGTIANMRGVEIQPGNGSNYTITTSSGIYIKSPVITTSSTLTHHYGIFLEDQTSASSGTNSDPHGIYVAGGGIQNAPRNFSTLPTCNAGQEGRLEAVNDDNTAVAWGATITGGGANHVLAYCDGTNWTIAAK